MKKLFLSLGAAASAVAPVAAVVSCGSDDSTPATGTQSNATVIANAASTVAIKAMANLVFDGQTADKAPGSAIPTGLVYKKGTSLSFDSMGHRKAMNKFLELEYTAPSPAAQITLHIGDSGTSQITPDANTKVYIYIGTLTDGTKAVYVSSSAASGTLGSFNALTNSDTNWNSAVASMLTAIA